MKMEITVFRIMVNDAFIDLLLSIVDIGTFLITFFRIVFKDNWMHLESNENLSPAKVEFDISHGDLQLNA